MKKICTRKKRGVNFFFIILFPVSFVKKKTRQQMLPRKGHLLLTERLAVSALIHSGIGFMSTYQNPIQGTVVLVITVIGTLLDSTLDTLICMAIHSCFLL